jgi:hypothetical protein
MKVVTQVRDDLGDTFWASHMVGMEPAVVHVRKMQSYNMDHEPWVKAGFARSSSLKEWFSVSSVDSAPTLTT